MKLSYNASIKDISAYAKLIYQKSPTVKEHLKKTYYFSVPTLLLFGAFIRYVETTNELIYVWGLLGICWLIYLPFYHKKKYFKKVIETFETDKHQNLFGTHELTIDDNTIIDTIESGQNKTEISKIEHVESVDGYTFVFINSAMAYLIPRKNIIDGNYHDFIYELTELIKKDAK